MGRCEGASLGLHVWLHGKRHSENLWRAMSVDLFVHLFFESLAAHLSEHSLHRFLAETHAWSQKLRALESIVEQFNPEL